MNYNVVAATNEDTVVATYEPSKVIFKFYVTGKNISLLSMILYVFFTLKQSLGFITER